MKCVINILLIVQINRDSPELHKYSIVKQGVGLDKGFVKNIN